MGKYEEELKKIKEKYGEIVLNTAIVCLVEKGIKRLANTSTKIEMQTIDNIFDNLEKNNSNFPFSRDFAKQVLSCQYAIYELDTMAVLTYFQKSEKGDDNE